MSILLVPAALRRIKPPQHTKLLLAFIFGNAILGACGLAWLRVPDSHIWQLCVSLVLGVVLVAAFFWLQTRTIRACRQPLDPMPLRLGAPLLAAWTLLLYLLQLPAARLDASNFERAGYWNSKLGAHARTIFTYPRLAEWQSDAIAIVFSFLIPAVLLPFLIETISRRSTRETLKNALRCLHRWTYWLTAALIFWLAPWLTSHLVIWQPGKSVSGEITSVILRLILIYLLDMALMLILFAVASELLARDASASNTRGNTTP